MTNPGQRATDPSTRARAVELMRRGKITMAEAAELAGVTRQGARRWAAVAMIDVAATRRAYLAKLWRSASER